MNKSLLALLCALLFCAIINTGCKKNEPEPASAKDIIAGTWLVTHWAEDYNNNKELDEQEKESATLEEEQTLVFKTDGTGYSSYVDLYDPEYNETTDFNWELVNNNTEIRITTIFSTNGDVTTARIKKLEGNEFIIETEEPYLNGQNILYWTLMQRK